MRNPIPEDMDTSMALFAYTASEAYRIITARAHGLTPDPEQPWIKLTDAERAFWVRACKWVEQAYRVDANEEFHLPEDKLPQ